MFIKQLQDARKFENYRVIDNSETYYNDVCYIFFSSNNIYYPDTLESFKSTIIEQDKYEWISVSKQLIGKKIYVRDIYKAWYILGINEKINTVEKLVQLLKQETQGYRIITIGNSAGGYAAMLIGALLKCSSVLCFSPQNNLTDYQAYWDNKIVPESIKNNYLYNNLNSVLKNYTGYVFYFYSSKCLDDVVQVDSLIKSNNIFLFPMHSQYHGQCIYPFNLPGLLNENGEKIIKLHKKLKKNKSINKIWFSVVSDGVFFTVYQIVMRFIRKIGC